MWILIRWLCQKPADLDLVFSQKKTNRLILVQKGGVNRNIQSSIGTRKFNFYLTLKSLERLDVRAYPGSEFVVAYTLAK